MKKINQSLSSEYLPLVIHQDEIEDIVNALKTQGSVKIKSAGFEYDSPDDLVENSRTETPKHLIIQCDNPYTEIRLTPHSSSLYIGSSDLCASGVYHQLDTILKNCRRSLSWLYNYTSLTLINILILSLPINSSPLPGVLPTLKIVLLAWLGWVLYIRLRTHSTIFLFSRKSKKTFWLRNKDQIAIAIISALLGGVLTVLGNTILTHLK